MKEKQGKKSTRDAIILKNTEALHGLWDKLSIVKYFNDPVKIQMFRHGNDNFWEQAKEDIKVIDENIIRPYEKNKNRAIEEKQAWRTNSLSRLERIYEAREEDLKALFDVRFERSKIEKGFITEKRFAAYESKDLRRSYSKYFGWFPILVQWVEYLEDIAGIEHVDYIDYTPTTEPENNYSESGLRGLESFMNDYKTLDDLFEDKKMIDPCISMLREVEKPVIDKKDNYIGGGGRKSVLLAWLEVLENQSVVRTCHPTDKVRLLNAKFPGLNMCPDLDRKHSTRADKYKPIFKKILSEVSQKGKSGK